MGKKEQKKGLRSEPPPRKKNKISQGETVELRSGKGGRTLGGKKKK